MQQGVISERILTIAYALILSSPRRSTSSCTSRDAALSLLLFIAQRVIGPEAESLAAEVEDWIMHHLGRGYPGREISVNWNNACAIS